MRWRADSMLLAAALCACGPTVPAGGVRKPEVVHGATDLEAIDIVPADLDVVIRVDIGKVKDGLGDESAREMVNRTLKDAGSRGILKRALAQAEVVWLGLRLADFEAGDRVLVVRTSGTAVKPEARAWRKLKNDGSGFTRYQTRYRVTRKGFERIYQRSGRELVFVSPVETMSVERVLRRGPDADRGQPTARGLFGVDYRASRLSPELEKRFRALARLVGGMLRVNATVDMRAGQLELEGRIRCKDSSAGERVRRFLDTFRQAGKRSGDSLLSGLQVERDSSTVTVRWPLPPAAVAQWIVRQPTKEQGARDKEQGAP